MKTQELKDLHTKTSEELKKLLLEAKNALMTLKLDHQQNKLKNTRELFNTRKKIAVLQTIMNIKQTIEAKPARIAAPARSEAALSGEQSVAGEAKARKAKGGKE